MYFILIYFYIIIFPYCQSLYINFLEKMKHTYFLKPQTVYIRVCPEKAFSLQLYYLYYHVIKEFLFYYWKDPLCMQGAGGICRNLRKPKHYFISMNRGYDEAITNQ